MPLPATSNIFDNFFLCFCFLDFEQVIACYHSKTSSHITYLISQYRNHHTENYLQSTIFKINWCKINLHFKLNLSLNSIESLEERKCNNKKIDYWDLILMTAIKAIKLPALCFSCKKFPEMNIFS